MLRHVSRRILIAKLATIYGCSGCGLAEERGLQFLRPPGDVLIRLSFHANPNGASTDSYCLYPVLSIADERGSGEAPPGLGQHLLQRPGADHGAEDVEHGDVSVTDAMQHNHVPDKVGVGLLPEWLAAFAPDGDDDRGDVERLRVSIEHRCSTGCSGYRH